MDLIELMRLALVEAERGLVENETPIGCVVARDDGRVVLRGHNRVRALGRPTAHAEMVAFESGPLDAAPETLVLVSTLEPCVMCLAACMESGIGKIAYGLRAPADAGMSRVTAPFSPGTRAPAIVAGGLLAEESARLLKRWLAINRQSKEAAYVEQLLFLVQGDATS